MTLHLNNLEHAVQLDHLHYNYLSQDHSAISVGLKIGETTDADVAFLASLAETPITHLEIKNDKQNSIYVIEEGLVLAALSDNISNEERSIIVELDKMTV